MRRSPTAQAARRFALALRQQGFLPTQHFVLRYVQRALEQGVRLDPQGFRSAFDNARHYAQTRPGYNTRIAVISGLPVLYRTSGRFGDRVLLVGLLPSGALPPVRPIPRPQREAESEFFWARLW
jgi:hypothetical protein